MYGFLSQRRNCCGGKQAVSTHVKAGHDKASAAALSTCIRTYFEHLADNICLAYFRMRDLAVLVLDVFIKCYAGVDADYKILHTHFYRTGNAQQECGVWI